MLNLSYGVTCHVWPLSVFFLVSLMVIDIN